MLVNASTTRQPPLFGLKMRLSSKVLFLIVVSLGLHGLGLCWVLLGAEKKPPLHLTAATWLHATAPFHRGADTRHNAAAKWTRRDTAASSSRRDAAAAAKRRNDAAAKHRDVAFRYAQWS
jgi:hypothetical protein